MLGSSSLSNELIVSILQLGIICILGTDIAILHALRRQSSGRLDGYSDDINYLLSNYSSTRRSLTANGDEWRGVETCAVHNRIGHGF